MFINMSGHQKGGFLGRGDLPFNRRYRYTPEKVRTNDLTTATFRRNYTEPIPDIIPLHHNILENKLKVLGEDVRDIPRQSNFIRLTVNKRLESLIHPWIPKLGGSTR